MFLVPLHLHLRGSVQIQKTLQPFIMNHNIHCQTEPQTPPPPPATGPILCLDCFLCWLWDQRGEIGTSGGVEVGGGSNNNICRAPPPPQSDPAKQINILFVYAENNNYFMVGCSVAAVGCMINLSSPSLKWPFIMSAAICRPTHWPLLSTLLVTVRE